MVEALRQLPRPLWFLYAGTTITRLGSFVFPYLTIYLADGRGFGTGEVGIILSVGSLGLLLGNLAGGVSSDLWSRKATLVLALLLNAAGFLGLAWSYETSWPYAAFLLLGYLGSGMYTPAANTLIADLSSERLRPFAYTVNYVCINVGMGLGPLLGGLIAAHSYRWLFLGDVLTSLACAGLLLVGIRTVRAPRRSGRDAPAGTRGAGGTPLRAGLLRTWRRHPRVAFFCLGNFFLIAPLMGLEYAVPLLVKREFGAELAFVGVVYTINALSILSLSFFVERLVRGRNEFGMMVAAGLLWTAGLAILVGGFSVTALLLCTAVWTLGEIIASILVPTFVSKNVADGVKGRFLALNDLMRSLAGVACPVGLGFLWQSRGVGPVLAVLLALPVLGVGVYLLLGVASRRRTACLPRPTPIRSTPARSTPHSA